MTFNGEHHGVADGMETPWCMFGAFRGWFEGETIASTMGQPEG